MTIHTIKGLWAYRESSRSMRLWLFLAYRNARTGSVIAKAWNGDPSFYDA